MLVNALWLAMFENPTANAARYRSTGACTIDAWFPWKPAFCCRIECEKRAASHISRSMAGKTVGVANVVCGVVQHCGIRETGAENQESADQKCEDTGGDAVVEGERNARNCRRSHDNLRDGAWETSHQLGTMPLINRQVSWLAASGAWHQ
jgi:hypothetical protein